MTQGLDLYILDDEKVVADQLAELARIFHAWGEVFSFSDAVEARAFLLARDAGLGIFVLDVYLGGETAFDFLDSIQVHYPQAAEDAIIITGLASQDVVDNCIAAGVNYLLQKPVKPYAFQLAVRAIAGRYHGFAKRLFSDHEFAQRVRSMGDPSV